ncbi:MAG: hypothetical protein PHE86_06965 [Candidatus Marinimicrobia bacterium]|nr:hypothetical protein [Candidatus Neomarinimicrobiota bacterium]
MPFIPCERICNRFSCKKFSSYYREERGKKGSTIFAKPVILPLKNPYYKTYRHEYPKIEGETVFLEDLHHHTTYLDGIGDPDECYKRSRDLFGDDFFALSEHDNFVGRPL